VVRRRLTDLTGNPEALDAIADLAQLDPLEAVDHADRGRALQQAPDELEPGDRLLLKLRYEQDLTVREIAALLDLPTAFHVYRRARAICALLRVRLTRLATSGQR
jgi:DNA-directed RNA polymerase specialized sigma subunit